MRSTKTSIWIVIVIGVLVAIALGASCNRDSKGESSSFVERLGEAPPEFNTLFEVYFALKEDHLNRDQLDATVLSQGAIRGRLARPFLGN